MQYKSFGNTCIIRLEKGEQVLESLMEVCTKENLLLGSFSAIGAIDRCTLAFFDPATKKYLEKSYDEHLEILSFTGNISTMEGKPYIHMHAVLGNEQFQAIGGHLKDARISVTCEIFIQKGNGEAERYKDPETGLNFLKL